jgi:hypothetical protein
MSYVYFNPNPSGKMVGDCIIRALSKILNMSWESVFVELMTKAF